MIPASQIHAYFNSQFSIEKSTNGWWNIKCPYCNDLVARKKMAVHFHHGWVKCFVCDNSKSVVDFVSDYEDVKYYEARAIIREYKPSRINLDWNDGTEVVAATIGLPTGYKPILDGKGLIAERARDYLRKRNFDLKELDRMGIGYCNEHDDDEDANYFGYIIIPFKQNGKLIYYIGRDFMGNQFLRYKNPSRETLGIGKGEVIFNGDILNMYDEVWLFEGWADACTIGRRGASTQGWSLSTIQKNMILKSNCKRIVFAPDAGSDGQGVLFYDKALRLAAEFSDHKEVKVLDLNVYGDDADGNSIGRHQLLELYEDTEFDDSISLIIKMAV